MSILISELESRVSGKNIARGNLESLKNPTALKDELMANRIDVLKLSILNPPPNLYLILNEIDFPYYVLGISIRYKWIFRFHDENQPFINNDLQFKEYKANEGDIDLISLLKEIYRTSTVSYFINPDDEITDEKQAIIFVNYIKNLNSDAKANHFLHIVFKNNLPVGVICSFKENDGGGVIFAGIKREFEGKGIYLDMINFIQKFGKSIGQKWGTADVQIQNRVVQKTFHKSGMIPEGYVLNIHINAMLGQLK